MNPHQKFIGYRFEVIENAAHLTPITYKLKPIFTGGKNQ